MKNVKKCFKESIFDVKNIMNFCVQNIVPMLITLFVLILTYGFEVTNFTLSIDEELAFVNKSNPMNWISQGRFGIALIKLLFHSTNVLPFWNTFLSVCMLFIAAFLWLKTFKLAINENEQDKVGMVLFAMLFITFPVHVEYIAFTTYNLEVSLGYIITALSVLYFSQWCVHQKTKLNLILGVAFFVFAISIYQSFVSVFIAGICTYYSLYLISAIRKQKIIDTKQILKAISRTAIGIIVGLIIYKCVDIFLQKFYPSTGYIEGFFAWGKVDFKSIIGAISKYTYSLIIGDKIYGGGIVFPTLIIGMVLMLLQFIKNKRKRLIIPVFIFGLLISPFILSFTLGSPTPLRAQQALPFMIGALWYIAYYSIDVKIIKKIIILGLIFVVIFQSQAITKLCYGDHIRYQQDIVLGHEIASRVSALGLGETPTQPVVCIGMHSPTSDVNIIRSEVIGHSFFEWDRGNPRRIWAFMKTIGYNYVAISQDNIINAKKIAKSMPSWPDKGSVLMVNDIIVVKLSE